MTNLPSVRSFAWFLLGTAVLGLVLATAATFAARLHWALDLSTHFRTYYVVAALLLLFCYVVGRRFRTAVVVLAALLVNTWFIAPLYLAASDEQAPTAEARRLKIASINLFMNSSAYDEVIDYVRATKPDLVVLVELTGPWEAGLAPLKADYPEWHLHVRRDPFGVGILSKLPLDDAQFENMIDEYPLARASLKVDGKPLTVFGVHPMPPIGSRGSSLRNGAIVALRDKVRATTGSVIVAGDLNITSWSPYFDDLLDGTRLRDSRAGRGLQTTWPTTIPQPLRISIDHFLVSPEIRIVERSVGPNVGSDHLPIEMEFVLQP